MKKGVFGLFLLFFGLFLLFLTSCDPPPAAVQAKGTHIPADPPPAPRYQGVYKPGVPLSAILPPMIYQGDNGIIVLFASTAVVAEECGGSPLACVRRYDGVRVMLLPNPCSLAVAQTELYAAVTCHELGHVNGWSGEHGPPPLIANSVASASG